MSDKQPKILQGNSLAPIVKGETSESGEELAYTITGGKGATIRTDRWRYTRWGENVENGNEELYDQRNDPEENTNLATDSGSQNVLKEMRQKLEEARSVARNGLATK